MKSFSVFDDVVRFDVSPSDFFLSRSEGLDHAEAVSTGFMVASGGGLSEGYVHGGPGVCLGDGQTEAEGVPSQGGRANGVCSHT